MNIKRHVIIIAAVNLLIIALCLAGYISGIGKDVVDVVVAPQDTTLILDDSTNIKPGRIKLKTGTHTIKATRQDFDDQTKEFTTIDGEENIIWFEMMPNNQAGIDYKSSHQPEFQKVYDLANGRVVKTTNQKTDDYPIIKYLPASTNTPIAVYGEALELPYSDEKYIINYGQSQKHPYDISKLALYITADHPAGKQSAIARIYSLGFDPSDYEIVFETSTASFLEEGTGVDDDFNDESADEDALYEDYYFDQSGE
jgi:hypothetical protein